MTVLTITITMAAAAALLNLWIAGRVGSLRHKHKVLIGDGGIESITARMRAHANFTEFTPLFLILIGLIELAEGPALWLWIVSILFILGRIAHALGMDRVTGSPLRSIGAAVSMLTMLGLAIYAITIPYRHGDLRPDRVNYVAVEAAALSV
jgi:uncharacterized membrane protein YecN with MAPEG domain